MVGTGAADRLACSAQSLTAPRRTGLIDARQGREQEREEPSERPVLEKNPASTAPAVDDSAQLPADTDAGARADLVLSYVLGRWARYAKGGFKRMPTENVSIQIGYFVS